MSDSPSHAPSSASTPTHAEIAAKLRRVGALPSARAGGGGSGGGGSLRNLLNSTSASGDATERPAPAPRGTETGPAGNGHKKPPSTRKLLHWSAAQWRAFEAMPLYTKPVVSARMLPIRAPLSSLYEIHFADERANYTPSALMEKLLAATRAGPMVNVGVVIDASGDGSYLHDPKEWDDWDVKFVKLSAVLTDDADDQARHDALETMTSEFFAHVEKHKASDVSDMDIAVFSTQGYNHVGYLIVRYLIEHCQLNLDVALKEFAGSTPPGIYDRQYLERLFRKYFGTLPSSSSTIKVPSPPKWAITIDGDEVADSSTAKIGSEILTESDHEHKFVRKDKPRPRGTTPTAATTPMGSSASSTPTNRGPSLPAPPVYKPPLYIPPDREDLNSRPTKRRKIRTWVDEVEPLEYGDAVDQSSDEHKRIAEALTKLTGIEGFPGCEAIPLTATHVAAEAFKKRGCLTAAYLVTWRARGRRCLLFVAEGGTYVVSRDMTFTKVDMKFPRRRAPAEAQVNTLIDGIMVEDEDHGHKVARFLAFDIVFLEGSPIWQKKLEKRLQCLQNEVIVPRKNDQTFDYAKEPFRVRMKDHFRLAKAEFLLTKFVRDVTHEVDGVIFTPTEAPYNLGGFESEDPVFKFVSSEGCGIPGLDGSITQKRLLQFIQTVPHK